MQCTGHGGFEVFFEREVGDTEGVATTLGTCSGVELRDQGAAEW